MLQECRLPPHRCRVRHSSLALKHALSSKAKSEMLVVIDKCELKDAKTKELKSRFAKLGFGSVLIIDGATVPEAFARGQCAAGRRHQRLRHSPA